MNLWDLIDKPSKMIDTSIIEKKKTEERAAKFTDSRYWSPNEKLIFLEQIHIFGKELELIANMLPNKTTA